MAQSGCYDLNSVTDAQTCAIRHIGIGIYSSGKIRDYLLKKGFCEDVSRQAVDLLIKRAYIDDVRAGHKVLLSRSGKKQESRAYLRQRLYFAGVGPDAVDKLMSEVEEDSVLCFNLYLSLRPTSYGCSERDEIEDELMKAATRRGFGYECSREAFNMWLLKVGNDKQE